MARMITYLYNKIKSPNCITLNLTEINPMYQVKISLQNKRTLKERLIKVRPQLATPTTRRASSVAASGAKAPCD